MQLGGARSVQDRGATRAVEITVVPASHDSTVSRDLLTDPEKKDLDADNVSLSLGPPSGYVVRFTNGLTVYLSGDTGIHADMKAIVDEFPQAEPVVLNLGPNAVTCASAAYAITDLVQARAPSSFRTSTKPRPAAASSGPIRARPRSSDLVKTRPVYLALSGRTMEFDGDAKCVAGC